MSTDPLVGAAADLDTLNDAARDGTLDAAAAVSALAAVRHLAADLERAELALSEAARSGGATWAQIAAAMGARGRQGAQKRHADLSRRYPRPPMVDTGAQVTPSPEPALAPAAAAPESARRPPGRPARAHAPRRERLAPRPPRITPAIIREGQYQLVKAPDYGESRAWHVLVRRTRAGLVRPTWPSGETGRAWEAVDLSGEVLPVTGTGRVTSARNARSRDAAAISLLSALLRQQERR